MKLLGENDVDYLYGRLHTHIKKLQCQHDVLFVAIIGSTSKQVMLHTLVAWAVATRIIHINQAMGFITQDSVLIA